MKMASFLFCGLVVGSGLAANWLGVLARGVEKEIIRCFPIIGSFI